MASRCVTGRVRENARRAAVISTPDLGVFAVAAAGVLCAFSYVVDTLSDSVSAADPAQIPLVAAVFRTNQLLGEHCSATCHRRRRPGQTRHTQGGPEITADTHGRLLEADQDESRPDLGILRVPGLLGVQDCWPAWGLSGTPSGGNTTADRLGGGVQEITITDEAPGPGNHRAGPMRERRCCVWPGSTRHAGQDRQLPDRGERAPRGRYRSGGPGAAPPGQRAAPREPPPVPC
jgi:hypothetical protein